MVPAESTCNDADVIGVVRQPSLRPAGSAAPLPLPAVTARAALGLQGDRHADALSPRQLLLATVGAYAAHGMAPHTLRENLLIDVDAAALASGQLLRIGADVVLRLMFTCEPCGQLNRHQPGLSGRIGRQRGMLARVLSGGEIHAGDPVRLLSEATPAWSDDWRARIALILQAMPAGMVVEYRQLAHLAGVPASYCRAFPRALQKMGADVAALAVPARSLSPLPRWLGAGLFDTESAQVATWARDDSSPSRAR